MYVRGPDVDVELFEKETMTVLFRLAGSIQVPDFAEENEATSWP
jgi:hypothetical protein